MSFLEFNESGIEPSPVLCLCHSATTHNPPIIQSGSSQAEQSQLDTTDNEKQLYIGQSVAGVCYPRPHYYYKRASGRKGECGILTQSRPAHTYLPIDRRRWSLASQAYERYSLQKTDTWKLRNLGIANWPQDSEIVDILVGIADEGFDFDRNFEAFLAAFTIAGLLYGGLHLIAWNSPFISRTQRLLWRISGIAIAASGPALLMLKLISFLVACIVVVDNGEIMVVVVMGCFLFYLFARTFLVIECFLSFAYLPSSIIQLPVWSQYFPHIS